MMIGSQVRDGVWRMIAGRDNIDVEEVVVVEAARIGMPDFRLDPPPNLAAAASPRAACIASCGDAPWGRVAASYIMVAGTVIDTARMHMRLMRLGMACPCRSIRRKSRRALGASIEHRAAAAA